MGDPPVTSAKIDNVHLLKKDLKGSSGFKGNPSLDILYPVLDEIHFARPFRNPKGTIRSPNTTTNRSGFIPLVSFRCGSGFRHSKPSLWCTCHWATARLLNTPKTAQQETAKKKQHRKPPKQPPQKTTETTKKTKNGSGLCSPPQFRATRPQTALKPPAKPPPKPPPAKPPATTARAPRARVSAGRSGGPGLAAPDLLRGAPELLEVLQAYGLGLRLRGAAFFFGLLLFCFDVFGVFPC